MLKFIFVILCPLKKSPHPKLNNLDSTKPGFALECMNNIVIKPFEKSTQINLNSPRRLFWSRIGPLSSIFGQVTLLLSEPYLSHLKTCTFDWLCKIPSNSDNPDLILVLPCFQYYFPINHIVKEVSPQVNTHFKIFKSSVPKIITPSLQQVFIL